MSVMDFVGKKVDFRRKGFSSSEVLLSLLAIGIVIAIFTSLNNFGGVKTQEQKVKLDKFENAIVSVQRSLVNNPEVSAQKACDVEFLKNYYLENLSNSKELDDFQINSTNVKAIKVDGYGVLAILPNADNNYCKEMWEKDELNVSNPPVAFVALLNSIPVSLETYFKNSNTTPLPPVPKTDTSLNTSIIL